MSGDGFARRPDGKPFTAPRPGDDTLSLDEITRRVREAREAQGRAAPELSGFGSDEASAWCEPCQRRHVPPRDDAHARDLRCKAVGPLAEALAEEGAVKPHPRSRRAPSGGRARMCVFAKPRHRPQGRPW